MLKAGSCTIDITPDTSCNLMGYEFRTTDLPSGNSGVLDQLHARVVVLHQGQDKVVIVSLDICIVPNEVADLLRQAVAIRLSISTDRVLLAATHTHSGPLPLTRELASAWGVIPVGSKTPSPEIIFMDTLKARLVEAVTRADSLVFPVEIGCIEAPIGLGYTRRILTEKGLEHCWNPQEQSHLKPLPLKDSTCSLVILKQKNGPREIWLWSMACHPVVLGKTNRLISADYPGQASQLLCAQNPYRSALFFLGAAADAHPWLATQENPKAVGKVALAAASMVDLLSEAVRFEECNEELKVISKKLKAGATTVTISTLKLGALHLFTLPCELFGELGKALRDKFNHPILLSTVSNGWCGYWPSHAAFSEGGYEVDLALKEGLQAGDCEKLIDEIAQL